MSLGAAFNAAVDRRWPQPGSATAHRVRRTGVVGLVLTLGVLRPAVPAEAHGGGAASTVLREMSVTRSAANPVWNLVVELEDHDSKVPIGVALVTVAVEPSSVRTALKPGLTFGSFAGSVPVHGQEARLDLRVTTVPGEVPIMPLVGAYDVHLRKDRAVVVDLNPRRPVPSAPAGTTSGPQAAEAVATGKAAGGRVLSWSWTALKIVAVSFVIALAIEFVHDRRRPSPR